MASTLLNPRSTSAPTPRRPLTLLASAGGAAAAISMVVTLMGFAVIGWFLSDGGAHGTPSDAMRVATLLWLTAHGSGVTVHGAPVEVIPLGLTALCGWVSWRFGVRVGEAAADHGPDADALADGERDWTVPLATALFAAAYVVVAVAAGVLAGTAETEPALPAVVGWSLLVGGGVGGSGIAVGSGRAAVWLALVPLAVRATLHAVGGVLRWFAIASGVALVGALAMDIGAALNVFSALHLDPGEAVVFLLLTALVLPNALVFSGSYLLGPGFSVGAGTVASPSVVALGPVPLFPLLAALPDNGETPAWTPWLVILPVAVAAVGVARSQRRVHPVLTWDQALVRGGSAGVLAGVLVGLLAVVAGGAVGPGRMADVGPFAGHVVVQAIVSLGLGGLLGAAYAVLRTRREPVDVLGAPGPSDDAADPGPVGRVLGSVTAPLVGLRERLAAVLPRRR